MKHRNHPIFCIGACLALLLMGAGCRENSSPPAKEAQVRLRNQAWTVELATTDQQRYQGLSGRSSLPADRGMLFVYPQEQLLSFCMRGCEIPIDIVFLDRKLRVVNLYEMKVESNRLGEISYRSHLPAMYALELPSGTIQRVGIRVGDQAEFVGVPPADQAESGL